MNQTDTTQIFHFTNSNVNEFIILLIATLIGAFVGFGLVLLLDRKKRHEETQQTVNNTLDAIIGELKTIKKEYFEEKNIFLSWNSTTRNIDGTSIMVRIPAYESSVNSGNFSLLEPSLQSSIARLYLRLDRCIFYSDQVMNFYATPIFASNNGTIVDREANRLTQKFNEHMEAFRNEIDEILPELKSAKTN